ncbi:hypothetical protein ACCS78_29320, partial [Rhizobium johnstonii]
RRLLPALGMLRSACQGQAVAFVSFIADPCAVGVREPGFFGISLAFAPNRMYGHPHSTRKAWDRPGEIRAVPPGGILEEGAVRLAEVQPEKE